MSFEVVCRTCDFSETVEKRPFANAYRIDHRTKHPDHDVDFQEIATDGGRDIASASPERYSALPDRASHPSAVVEAKIAGAVAGVLFFLGVLFGAGVVATAVMLA